MAKRIGLPDGSIGEFPDTMPDSEIEAVLQKQYAADLRPSSPGLPKINMEESHPTLVSGLLNAGEVGKGAVKGALHTMAEAGKYGPTGTYAPAINLSLPNGPSPANPANPDDKYTTPTNTPQKLGYTGEQIGEYFFPVGAEEHLGQLTKPLLRIGESATEGALRNKLQGGDLSTGAIAGAGAGATGEAFRAAASGLAESALGITKRMRGYGKTPGAAVLEEINGVRPSTIFENATGKTNALRNEIDSMAANSPARISTLPAIGEIDNAIAKASAENNAAGVKQLQQVRDALTTDINSGLPLATNQSATKALNLKRGLRNQFITNWNPETMSGTRAVAARASHALDTGLDQSLGPGFASANQRISSLIPVAERAESLERGAGTGQRVANRMLAHTGALTGAAAGSAFGYEHGGLKGGIVGGLAGLVAPELIASPTSQMLAARAINSPALPRLLLGTGSQLDRKKSNPENPESE